MAIGPASLFPLIRKNEQAHFFFNRCTNFATFVYGQKVRKFGSWPHKEKKTNPEG